MSEIALTVLKVLFLALLWLFVGLLALMLLQIRNVYGLLVVLAAGGALFALTWYGSAPTQTGCATLLTWILLLAAPKPVVELGRQHRAGRADHSDAGQLSRLTRLPAALWIGVFGLLNLAGLATGTALLVPALLVAVSAKLHCGTPKRRPSSSPTNAASSVGSISVAPPWSRRRRSGRARPACGGSGSS